MTEFDLEGIEKAADGKVLEDSRRPMSYIGAGPLREPQSDHLYHIYPPHVEEHLANVFPSSQSD